MLLRKHRKICQCYISIHAPANRAVTHTQNVHICFHTCTCHKCAHTHTRSAICLGVQRQHRSPWLNFVRTCAYVPVSFRVWVGARQLFWERFVCVCDHSSARSGEVCECIHFWKCPCVRWCERAYVRVGTEEDYCHLWVSVRAGGWVC